MDRDRQRQPEGGDPLAPEGGDHGAGDGRVAQLEAELAQATTARDERQAAYVRLAADLDNFRKRKAQELADERRYGGAPLLVAILPALDNLSRAVEHLPDDGQDQLAAGLRLTLRQLEAGLAAEGITTIPAVGEAFDPAVHEAVATEPGGAIARDTVVAELRRGYRYHDRVVRPAQVRVARAGEPLEPAPPSPGDGGDTPGPV
ncbi:MAG TPA: nucleotide exchange factor GrpE [Verrucomicrobiae bacterium]|nr:nucleotide exchange factor GrpE [Verrucomicrobiae bacterium]